MINKKIKEIIAFLSIFSLAFLAGCSKDPNKSSFLIDKFIAFGEGLLKLLGNEDAIFGLMFVAILFGSFALYKALLRFAFRRTDNFKNKEINVIAFMIAIISTAGIAFIFGNSPKFFIILFGGSAGLLLVLFIVFFIMRIFYEFAEEVKNEDGLLKKGPGWIFLMILGVILSSYLLLGYSTKVLKELSCNVNFKDLADLNARTCEGGNLFTWIASIAWDVLGWAIFLAIIFGIWWFISRNKKDSDEDDDKDIGTLGRMFGGSSEKDKEKEKEIDGIKSGLENIHKSFTKMKKIRKNQKELLNNMNKFLKNRGDKRSSSDIANQGGNN